MAHRAVVTALPEQGCPGPLLSIFSGGKRQQIKTINVNTGRRGRACSCSQCRHNVDVGDRHIYIGIGHYARGPLDEQRHPQPPLEIRQLPTTIGRIDIWKAKITWTAIITGEHHQGVFRQPLLFKRGHNAANTAVQCAYHGCIHTKSMRRNITDGLVILSRGLQRRVRTPMREVQKERSIFVRLDDRNRFVSPVISQITTGLETLIASVVETGGIVQAGPQKLINGIESQLGIHHIGIVFG